MTTLAAVDAGLLYAAADARAIDHEACLAALSRPGLRLVVAAPALAERLSSGAAPSRRFELLPQGAAEPKLA